MIENKVVVHYFESDIDGSKNLQFIIKGTKTSIIITIGEDLEDSGWILISDELDICENGALPDEVIDYIKEHEKIVSMYHMVNR